MGITNNIPPSRLIQPGVIDNTAARPASPFEGQCIFQKDTDQLLVWNGTAWVMPNKPAQNPDGLEFIASSALSGTATNFVGCFTTTYDNYRIEMTQLNATVGWFSAQMLTGTTPLTTGAYYLGSAGRTSSGVIVGDSAAAAPMAYLAYAFQAGGACVGSYDIMTPQKTTQTFFHGNYSTLNTGSGTYNFYSGGAAVDSSSAYDGLRILHSAGAIISGNVSIYGYRK